MRPSLAALLMAGATALAHGQNTPATLAFSLDRTGPPTVQYSVAVTEDGTGRYTPRVSAAPMAAAGEAREIRLAPALVRKLFAAVPTVEGGRCETHIKNLAKTGTKVLHYTGAGRDAQCTFNYSDDDRVNDATSAFQALAETMQYGDRLRAKLRFDRLGLDSELEGLQSAVSEQRALEVGNIAPVLRSILEDERVMERVRRKAQQLLQGAAPAQAEAAGTSSSR